MVRYRRNIVPGGTFFFTVTLRDRRSSHLTNHISNLRNAFRVARRERPFAIDAIVILPEHLHAIWTLPDGDADFSGRWRRIKGHFSRNVAATEPSLKRKADGEYRLWQSRFWEHIIRNDNDFARHVDYIHFNPVRHGLVSRVADWAYSSFHAYVRESVLPADWAGNVADDGSSSANRVKRAQDDSCSPHGAKRNAGRCIRDS
jgi:putative transposase